MHHGRISASDFCFCHSQQHLLRKNDDLVGCGYYVFLFVKIGPLCSYQPKNIIKEQVFGYFSLFIPWKQISYNDYLLGALGCT